MLLVGGLHTRTKSNVKILSELCKRLHCQLLCFIVNLIRILRSLEANETVNKKILRERKGHTATVLVLYGGVRYPSPRWKGTPVPGWGTNPPTGPVTGLGYLLPRMEDQGQDFGQNSYL